MRKENYTISMKNPCSNDRSFMTSTDKGKQQYNLTEQDCVAYKARVLGGAIGVGSVERE